MTIVAGATPDNWTVKVTNPGGASSNVYGFTVVAPTPTITSVVPNPVTGSGSAQTISIYGSNFVSKPSLTLTWTNQPNFPVPASQVTFVSSTEVQIGDRHRSDTGQLDGQGDDRWGLLERLRLHRRRSHPHDNERRSESRDGLRQRADDLDLRLQLRQ